MILKMLVPFCTLAVAIIYVAFQEKWWKIQDGRRVRHKLAVRILVFFLFLSTIATWVILYRDARDSQDLQCQVKKLGDQLRGLGKQNAQLLTKIENCQPPQRIGALKPKYKGTGSGSASKGVRVAVKGQMVNITAPEGAVLQPFGRNIAFSLRRTAEGLLVSAIVHNLDGRVIARVIENDWVVYDGRYLRRNFDEHAIEMLDDYDVTVLQVEYVTPTSVRVGGVFRAESKIIADIDKQFPVMRGKGGAFFCTTSGGGRLILGDQAKSIGGRWPTTDAERQALATEAKSLITPWFDYTIPDRLGVRYLQTKESIR